MKRKHTSVSSCTRSKKPKLVTPLLFIRKKRSWVAASKTKNYLINDPLVDWLELYSTPRPHPTSFNHILNGGFNEFIKNKGIEFEKELVKYINDHKHPVVFVSSYITDKSVKKTEELMRQGVPIIHSAPLRNNRNRTMGIADLLVRSDYLGKIIDNNPLTESEIDIYSPKLNKPYYYVVIDIKFTTLKLRANGVNLLNSDKIPAYKSQVWIYTQAVGQIQGYTPRYAYILGRRWVYTKRGCKKQSIYCLNKLGVVDFEGVDNDYKRKTIDAIKWYRNVKQFGGAWELYPPEKEELYPNMCVDSGKWNTHKEDIANELGEITVVWNCGVKNRKKALDHNITSWRDKKCNSRLLGITGKREKVVDNILDVNRQRLDKLRPQKIVHNNYNWRTEKNEMFVDFETLIDVFSPIDGLPRQEKTNQIFMIGVYYKKGEFLEYKNFICNELTLSEELRIMDEFRNFVKSHNDPKLWFWHAERSIWNRAENRHDKNWERMEWCDMAQLFRETPIVIKDCFNFGLKTIVKAMRKHGLIQTIMDSECDSGKMAAIKAWNAYKNSPNPSTHPVIQDIARYNTFDVEALYDIITYLRNNH